MHHPDLWNDNAAICAHRSTLATYPYLHPFSHQNMNLLVILSTQYSESTQRHQLACALCLRELTTAGISCHLRSRSVSCSGVDSLVTVNFILFDFGPEDISPSPIPLSGLGTLYRGYYLVLIQCLKFNSGVHDQAPFGLTRP